MAEIDSLEIEISAESSAAVEKINSLTQALQGLKSALSGEWKSPGINKLGQGASQAEKNVAEKYRQAKAGARPRNVTGIERRDVSELRDVKAAAMDGMLKISGPEIDTSAVREVEEATQVIDDYMRTSMQIQSVAPKEHLAGEFNSISQALKGTGIGRQLGQISGLVGQVEQLGTASAATGGSMAGMGGAAAGAGSSLAALAGPIGVAVAALEILKQRFEENKEFLQSDRSIWTDATFENLAGGLTNVGAALMTVNPLIRPVVYGLRSFIQPGQELLGVLSSLAEGGFQKAGNALRQFASSGLQKAGDAVKAFGSNVGKGFASVAGNIGNKFIKPFQSAIDTVSRWKKSIGWMAFYQMINAAIRTVTEGIREGIDNLYQYSNAVGTQFAPAMNSLASSSLYLKNSLAAMAAPLIQAVAPAIDFVISKLVTLLNLIGAVLAALTGQGFFTKATKGATEFGGAVGGAAGAAKELKDYMLGIDELNVINDDSGGGGGGGGGGGLDYGSMFEEVPLPDWAQKIKDAIEKGDWYGAGEILAEHLNGLLDAWDPEPWGNALGEKITHGLDFALGFLRTFNFDELGGKLATAINSIGDGINFTTLGKVIGAGWNVVFKTANGFFSKLDWEGWGKHIAKAISGWNDEVDWNLMAETFNNGVKGLLKSLTTIVTETPWGEIATNISTAINNVDWYGIAHAFTTLLTEGLKAAAEAAMAFATDIHWDTIATEIANGINDALGNMTDEEWKTIGESIGTLIEKAVGGIGIFLKTIKWEQIGEAIAEMLKGVPWENLLFTAGDTIAAGFNALVTTVYTVVKDPEFWDELGDGVKAGVKAFASNFQIGDTLDALGTLLGEGVQLAVTAVNELVATEEFWSELGDGIRRGVSAFFGSLNPEEITQAAFGLLQRAIDAAIVTVSALAENGEWFSQLGTSISTGINNLVQNTDWASALTNLAKLATDLMTGIANALRGIHWEDVRAALKDAFDNIEWGPLIDAALDMLSEVFKATAELKLTQIDIFGKIGGELGKGLGQAIDKGLSSIPIFGSIYTAGKTVLEFMGLLGEAVVAVTTGQWGLLPGIVDDALGLLNQNLNTKGTEMTQAVSRFLADSNSSLKAGLDAAKRAHSSALQSMETTTSAKYTNMRNTTSTQVSGMRTVVERDFPAMQRAAASANSKIQTNTSQAWSATKQAVSDANAQMNANTTETWNAMNTSVVDVILPPMKKGVKAGFTDMKKSIETAMRESKNTTKTQMGEIYSTTQQKSLDSLNAMKTNFGQVDYEINTALNTARTNAQAQDWSPVGRSLINGVSAGVRQQAQELCNTVVSGITAALNAAKRAAGIHSPARVWRKELGQMLGLGVAVGVEDSIPQAVASVNHLQEGMKQALSGQIAADMPLNVPMRQDITAQYSAELMGGKGGAEAIAAGLRTAIEDMTDRLLSALRTVVEAINGVADRPIEVAIDGKKNMQAVEKAQRQRGANILAGGVMA